MNVTRLPVIMVLLLSSLTQCGPDDTNIPIPTEASQTELLVATNWHTVRVSTPDGQELNKSRLNLATQVLFDLNMQFRNNGTVRALDPKQSNSVINGGTWKLTPDNQSIDVDVQGFKGNFPIITLNKNKLVLRQRAPVDGKDEAINLEFEPTL